jgi:hypothetical protein
MLAVVGTLPVRRCRACAGLTAIHPADYGMHTPSPEATGDDELSICIATATRRSFSAAASIPAAPGMHPDAPTAQQESGQQAVPVGP